MAYKVIKDFTDEQSGGRVYRKDNVFPAEGLQVTDERLKELSTKENKRNEVLIEEVKAEEKEIESLEHLTVAQLKEQLDGKGIEYKANDKKPDLIKLLEK